MAISAKQVKALRDATGAGMMDCKKALEESEGDLDAARDWLQKKGMAAAKKRAGRSASEGTIAAFHNQDGSAALLLEVNCETDFVARNDEFQGFVAQIGQLALEQQAATASTLLELDWDGAPVSQRLMEQSGKTGENLILRRLEWIRLPQGANGSVASYIHDGKIGVLVGGTTSGDAKAGLDDILRDVAMHVAALDPAVVSSDRLDPALVDKQVEILSAQAAESGKPAAIIEKMVQGRVAKWKKEISLLDQPFVKDGDITVGQYLGAAGKERLGGPVELTAFVRFALGDQAEGEG